ncbi:hypothetical protein CC1G_06673 [Coprinopsis cinerea okayama7|uniref:Nephrocystin 3-like N-terminal domain-containing protein n=1 Tax=Coprinopsis cinerea (strain Okayama-7 / 130 / ATCC MYA-4618 / FGSC 9003) TaxID=240176 RepID=A8P7Z1_COPC7|nr:hypothetical protein CC1G_06673 [Coprinopsis cinerea okayama7\|eukprot:XP_001839460.2 hypothetical protein CC1G_06673 [Coprinopsis cinerea okayama7\
MPKATSDGVDFPTLPTIIQGYIPEEHHADLPSGFMQTWWDPYYKKYAAYWLYRADVVGARTVALKTNTGRDSQRSHPFQSPRHVDIRAIEKFLTKIADIAEKYILDIQRGDKRAAQSRAETIGTEVRQLEVFERQSNRRSRARAIELSFVTNDETYQSIVKRRRVEASLVHAVTTIHDWNIGFRQRIILDFARWLEEDGQKRILWVYGEPGCGKSVITYWFADHCSQLKSLAASYKFTASCTQRIVQDTFLANLVTDFETYIGSSFTNALADVVGDFRPQDREDFFQRPPKTQLLDLIVPTFNKLPERDKKPLLVVLDGIDKCDEWAAKDVFHLIKVAIEHLPICFFISCHQNDTIDYFLRRILADHVERCDVPFKPNPDSKKNKTPTAANFTIPEHFDAEDMSPPMTPLPDLYPASDDEGTVARLEPFGTNGGP